ncbi:DUF423 domain-containing protein [Roseibium suaedae]|uniref:Uncharacterized membrane protein YgdD, TMEM256/DUF423 family n=1 Tax=Roseibium suaedae TaxID=735517 RepID=A0A1M7PC81_9HYPH|nr:DUF423 domain-containing protein [Roseibium suaedae]SHN14479.1 Uncharacterized membrane protein YgdD, TMEM256/DUF423 family [Roseibium suaedae]
MTQDTSFTAPLFRAGLFLGGLAGAAGVALMAASAHLDDTGLLRLAAEMLLFHAPALLAIGALSQMRKAPLLPVAAILMTCGLILFCGDLTSRAMLGDRLFSMAAPTGGSLMILSWLATLSSAFWVRPR